MTLGGTLRIEVANAVPPATWKSERGTRPALCVALTVADTGAGMPPEVKARIFEPFFTTKGPGKGTGLGLAMVHGVVTQSGGCITVDSEPNRGTRFVIYLPATAETPLPAPRPVAVLGELRGSETVLLVEDEGAIRELIRKVLSGYGYRVLNAIDTVDALAIAERHDGPIDLLVSDVVMPHMSGPELAQRLVPRRPEMRVLYMSGFGNRLATGFGSVSAGVQILHKPFTPESLALKVRESLRPQHGVASGVSLASARRSR
jgi:two-component system, cell cycle sensor histidine kinase and response regulator CckA